MVALQEIEVGHIGRREAAELEQRGSLSGKVESKIRGRDAAACWLEKHAAAERRQAQAQMHGRALKWTRKHPRSAWPDWVKVAL